MTWTRRLGTLLNRLGLQPRRLGGDTVLLTRRGRDPHVRPVSEGVWLVDLGGAGGKGTTVEQVDSGGWLVQDPGENALTVERLAGGAAVVQRRRGRRRAVLQMGRKELRTHLLVDRRAARANLRQHQRHLSKYLADEHIAWMLRELRINCVLDVGANVGQYAKELRRAGYRGRIVSFEPLPHLAERLGEAAAGDPDWHVLTHALGDTDDELEMNVTPGGGVTSSLLAPSEFGREWSSRLRDTSRQTIRVRRLDDVFDEVVAGLESPRVYLKMDTQGYDLQVFAGAGERIKQVLGMQSEVSSVPIYDGMPRLPEQIAIYEAAGFENTGMFPVTRDARTHRVIEFDVVMIRVEALESPPR